MYKRKLIKKVKEVIQNILLSLLLVGIFDFSILWYIFIR